MKNRIKDVIKEKGITQKQLASMIGMSEVGISKAINGSASMDTISKIAEALSMDKNNLIDCNVLVAKYGSDKTPLKLGNLELPCYVLEDGTRVFSGRGIQSALGAGDKKASGTWLTKFVNSEAVSFGLKPKVLEQFNNPIIFKVENIKNLKSDFYGYEATLLIDLCSAIIDANETQKFDISPVIVANANIIIRSVAKVGIIALVDEVTGFNKAKERAEDALQRFLNTFMSEEAAKWVKVFGDTFFEDLYKMHNWNWEKTNKRPGVVGTWINDIVYERIAPLVLAELKRRNPRNENGNRSYKHHQFLTKEVGLPKLRQHLEAIHAIAMISNYNWSIFMHYIDKVYPKQYQQLNIDFDFDMETNTEV
ncbi:P63C domain-containing protein [Phocaeicola coprocola]|uniref:P63C domain-containing protein n=1 Tax=Phocaeicola coprocola TaxID=310298 RepID=UPI0026702A49|nr:P63C domain-containing protein [Phocaeicola coprocola]